MKRTKMITKSKKKGIKLFKAGHRSATILGGAMNGSADSEFSLIAKECKDCSVSAGYKTSTAISRLIRGNHPLKVITECIIMKESSYDLNDITRIDNSLTFNGKEY